MKVVLCEHHPYDSVLRLGSHSILKEFRRRGYEVAWLSHPRTPWVQWIRGREMPPLSRRHPDGTLEVHLESYAPFIDVPFFGSVFWGLRWFKPKAARHRLQQLGLGQCDLLWISDFTQLPLLDLLDARCIVFRVFDQIDQFRWMPRSIYRLIRRYHHRATLVVASSRAVQERLVEEGIEADYLPNGADLEGFNPSSEAQGERLERAAYVGALESWFDLAAVEHWAAALPGVDFAIAGPNPHGLRSALPNVRFLGPISRRDLPAFLRQAKVGLIPFHLNPLTRGVCPLKLYDYLAAGCGVLSAALPEVEADPEGVFLYRCPEEGVEILRRCLTRSFDLDSLYNRARLNGWDRRLDSLLPRLGLPTHLS